MASPEVPATDYEKLYEDVKGRPCRVDRIERAYLSKERKPLRTRSHIIDRELEVRSDQNLVTMIQSCKHQARY